ncbi:MAG: ABC transporter ATP-binding protein [Eubacterium sp.]|nr:ABC transporter ATP-binding protein [Eubacterium sp.]MCM1213022.1 ABC transporter ATP-binding protein [Lachnospiraceae bacterium]MCM1304164.1 ABC transporter ATP-binding protein [Butyrivibrio sp.]MCM1344715.1 ABC transporter ATP-binding protein [Muribaculaceae bacterium]MCM1241116.1 ABC transporter ATP-binding protein [Lachnospiraceae bacterium]
MKKTLLKTENLSKSFSNGGILQHVLKNIDLELYQGDFTVIMGASGAGKSTLLYALSGMDTPSLGTVTFGDKVISSLDQDGLAVFRRQYCGFVFQQVYLIDSMSVMDNVLAAGLLVNRDKKALTAKARELFAAVDIPEETQRKFPTQLSGGEAQRVGIVRGLVNSPEILFADEPTGALNSQTGLDVLDTLTRFNEQGQSIVMVTHDMRSARRGNRILYLKDGAIMSECDLGKYTHGDTARREKLAGFLAEMGW